MTNPAHKAAQVWHNVNDAMPPFGMWVVVVLDDDEEMKGALTHFTVSKNRTWYAVTLEDGTTTNRVKAWRYL